MKNTLYALAIVLQAIYSFVGIFILGFIAGVNVSAVFYGDSCTSNATSFYFGFSLLVINGVLLFLALRAYSQGGNYNKHKCIAMLILNLAFCLLALTFLIIIKYLERIFLLIPPVIIIILMSISLAIKQLTKE
ncbi:MAG: hypothetical protein J1F36_04740 [Clostridiales bacterium]|nr:hypothetical protein [Clostridiales bacterium]